MKNCSWYLLLRGKKIYNIRELRESFDTNAVTAYYCGGGLWSWLTELGENEILARLEKIDNKGDIGGQLEFIFGVRPEPPEPLPENTHIPTNSREIISTALPSSYRGSFKRGSFRKSSFYKGSFRKGSFTKGVLLKGSFRQGLQGGSYRKGSFVLTSYKGAFAKGSFKQGSFNKGSFKADSFTGGSFMNGTYYFCENGVVITEKEYRRTMINLSSCPLNEYGYGIHLV
ncbi:MAG: hypothetical protein ACI4KR_10790 [Ruminiclostridium sp.]